MTNTNYTIEHKDKKSAIAGTVTTFALHGFLLLILMYVVLYPPNPPLEESGMTMSLGEENMGGPSEMPVENPQPNENYTVIEEQAEIAPNVTQDIEETVEINNKPKKENKVTPVAKPIKNEEKPKLDLPEKVDMRALFKKNDKNNGDAGRGGGDIPGNEGRPDGDPNGDPDGNGLGNSGDGTGKDGVSFSLAGRSIKKLPEIEDNSRETGRVVVSIVVNKNGEVIKAVPGQKGTTTLNPTLLEKAKQGAYQAKFSPRDGGSDEQFGTMTIVFRFKP